MSAYVTGEVDKSLLAKVDYLIEENRVPPNQISKRISQKTARKKVKRNTDSS